MDKYKINECMDKLTYNQHKLIKRLIPGIIRASINTFHNYRKLQMGDDKDIPYETVRILEVLFGLEVGELANFEVKAKSARALFKEHHVALTQPMDPYEMES